VGAIRLAEALERNTSLRELHLSSNFIGKDGAIRLAASLEKNMTLRVISLICECLWPRSPMNGELTNLCLIFFQVIRWTKKA